MFKKITLLFSLLLLSSCSSQASLSKEELSLLDTLKFDTTVIQDVKTYIREPFTQYETSDPGYLYQNGKKIKTGITKQEGITFIVKSLKAKNIISVFSESLATNGYLIFISEIDYINNQQSISIIKSSDQFDIVRLQKTDGINYDIDNAALINKLTDWDRRYGIKIIGADYDWVEFEINQLPPDTVKFADEIYAFCPDSIDQGVGTKEALIKEIESRKLFLWWD
jgi:hypothetical protein